METDDRTGDGLRQRSIGHIEGNKDVISDLIGTAKRGTTTSGTVNGAGITHASGERSESGTAAGIGTANSTGSNAETNKTSVVEEFLTVEPPKEKPKRKYTRRKQTGTVKPEQIEALTVQVFALASMIRNAKYWAVQDVNIEVKPWSPAAAELLNEHLPSGLLERAITANAAVAVAVGLGTMIFYRLQTDAMMAKATIPPKPNETTPSPPSPPRQESAGQMPPSRGTNTYTGAKPVHPTGIITGIQRDSFNGIG